MLRFEQALDNDLNISGALGALFDFIRDTNKRLAENAVSIEECLLILEGWRDLDAVLGLGDGGGLGPPAEVMKLAIERHEARGAKDFKRADELRVQLASMGWVVKDEKNGFSLKRMQPSQ